MRERERERESEAIKEASKQRKKVVAVATKQVKPKIHQKLKICFHV